MTDEKEALDGICQHCGEYFRMLKQHILYKHETNKPWKCVKCDYSHATRGGLRAHVRYMHASENDMKMCHICGFSSANKSTVKG